MSSGLFRGGIPHVGLRNPSPIPGFGAAVNPFPRAMWTIVASLLAHLAVFLAVCAFNAPLPGSSRARPAKIMSFELIDAGTALYKSSGRRGAAARPKPEPLPQAKPSAEPLPAKDAMESAVAATDDDPPDNRPDAQTGVAGAAAGQPGAEGGASSAGRAGTGSNEPVDASLLIEGLHAVFKPPVPYPAGAVAQEIQGEVEVVILVDTSGTILDAAIQKTTHPIFSRAVLHSARSWRFKPPVYNGVKVRARAVQHVVFQLENGD